MNTLPINSNQKPAVDKQPQVETKMPSFLLSKVPPCQVEIVVEAGQETQPSKTEAELLADGQCEV